MNKIKNCMQERGEKQETFQRSSGKGLQTQQAWEMCAVALDGRYY